MTNAILRAIIYFDLFDYPLTTLEVWKYAPTPGACSFFEVVEKLGALESQGKISTKDGFWFLFGHEEIVRVRRERYLIAERKYRKVNRAVRFLKHIPGIRMIAVANTLAWSHARDGSDIDLFIVTRPGTLWTSRLLGVTPFAVFGLRPNSKNERDTFCFSFFAAENALDFSPLAIKPDDPYLLYWIATLAPVYDPDGLMAGLWEANVWARKFLPNAFPSHLSSRRGCGGRASLYNEMVGERAGLMEHIARAVQLARFPVELKSIMNCDHRVVVSDEILKFHKNDRREAIAERYRKQCQKLCL